MKKYNFGAGPSILPQEVIRATADACLNFDGMDLSLMEISHRSANFQAVIDEARALVAELLQLPEDYSVIFLGGGASTQFCYVPYNLLERKAAYLNTGTWAKNALKEAKLFGEVVEVASSEDANYTYLPKDFTVPADVDYFHVTTNNTIYGTEWHEDFDVPVPLVADMSSDIFSRVIDPKKYALIYAGAQKNLGPAGITIVIVRDDLIGKARKATPSIWNYETQKNSDSMINTPPTFAWYLCALVFKHLLSIGGLPEIEQRNQAKAKLLYDYLDGSDFYQNNVAKANRSLMNVTFTTGNDELNAKFVAEATAAGLQALKGHKVLGGMRASIYNAMPIEGVQALIQFMQKFAKENA